jgi:hypothetical protein
MLTRKVEKQKNLYLKEMFLPYPIPKMVIRNGTHPQSSWNMPTLQQEQYNVTPYVRYVILKPHYFSVDEWINPSFKVL